MIYTFILFVFLPLWGDIYRYQSRTAEIIIIRQVVTSYGNSTSVPTGIAEVETKPLSRQMDSTESVV